MAKNRNKRYEKSGGRGRAIIAFWLFILVAGICDAVMLISTIHTKNKVAPTIMIIFMTAVFVFIAFGLLTLIRNIDATMYQEDDHVDEAETVVRENKELDD